MTATLTAMQSRPPVAALLLLGCLLAFAGCSQPKPPQISPKTTEMNAPQPPVTDPEGNEIATFGAGCFWCSEAVLSRIDGVHGVTCGYMGGTVEHPSYAQVCRGDTGHAEVVQVAFDPSMVSYSRLLDVFFQMHDPTTLNRQGNDVGTQYRSVIFYHSDAQREAAQAAIARWQHKYADPIVTAVTPAGPLWPAEDYHQDYWLKNPTDGYCRLFIPPKLKKLGLEEHAPRSEQEDHR